MSTTPHPDGGTWEARRADARRNHQRVLAAAAEVFTQHGLDATIPQVAARAGVGKATVYRSYPTKADLVAALAQVHVEWLQGLVAEAAAQAQDGDAYDALEAMLHEITACLAHDRLMVELLTGAGWGAGPQESDAPFVSIIDAGRRQGRLRPDATVTDVQVLVGGFARALIELDERDPDVWRRYASLALAALRP